MRLKRCVAFLLGIAFTGPLPALATPFADVPGNHWAYQEIQSLAADGLLEGYPDGTFLGNRPPTRYKWPSCLSVW